MNTLKLASNKIQHLSDLDHLKEMKCLENLDLENNEVTKMEGYKDYVWNLIPTLVVLDNFNKEGEEVLSEDDYGSYGDEDDQLTEEQLAELKRRGITPEEFLNGMDSEEGEIDFEDGEDDFDDDEDESEEFDAKNANKRSKQ